jgi:hypothetical protein
MCATGGAHTVTEHRDRRLQRARSIKTKKKKDSEKNKKPNP